MLAVFCVLVMVRVVATLAGVRIVAGDVAAQCGTSAAAHCGTDERAGRSTHRITGRSAGTAANGASNHGARALTTIRRRGAASSATVVSTINSDRLIYQPYLAISPPR